MITYMPRNCFEPGGFVYEFNGGCERLPPNVAGREQVDDPRQGSFVDLPNGGGQVFVRDRRDVTWDEVMQRRRERQAEIMVRKLRVREPDVLPCYVWTFFNRQDIPYHGWYCYIQTFKHHHVAVLGKYGLQSCLAESVMSAFPCGLLPLAENFETWMAAFAKTYPRRKRADDPRKAGLAYGWLTDRRTFSVHQPPTINSQLP